ncbi:MAG: 30S ribosomal protein S20, partial [Luminiphilus sp.]|nr:30S ribosomal protein S20 [Luminiphilus sp.]
TGEHGSAQDAYNQAVPVIDRMANKGIINKNKAARHKSRLNAKVKALAAG